MKEINKAYFSGIVMLFLVLVVSNSHAQKVIDTTKAAFKQTIMHVNQYNPTITDANKISEWPEAKDSIPPTVNSKYSVINRRVDTKYTIDTIKSAKMKGEPLDPLQRAYIKLGLGNFTSTYADVHVNTVRSRNKALGLNYRQFGSRGDLDNTGPSDFSQNSLEVYGRKFLKKHSIGGSIDLDRNVLHYYGYDPSIAFNDSRTRNNTRQEFLRSKESVSLKSFYRDSAKLNHDLKLTHYYLDDNNNIIVGDSNNARENNFDLAANVSRYFGKEQLSVNSSVNFNSYRHSTAGSIDNTIVMINPSIISGGENWRVQVGLNAFADIGSESNYHFYPNAYIKYNLIRDIVIPYAGVTGGLERNSLNSFVQDNPFINTRFDRNGQRLENKNVLYDIYGGIRGAFSSKASFNLGVSRSRIENLPLYVTPFTIVTLGNIPDSVIDYFAGNQLAVIYEEETDLVQLTAEATYEKSDQISILLTGNYYAYDTKTEFEAWHLPTYSVALSGIYDLKDKFLFRADIFMVSERKARTPDPEDQNESYGSGVFAKNLKGYADLNLNLEYRYTKRLSAFVSLNNLVAANYQRWYNYPTQQFNILGGLTYTFWEE